MSADVTASVANDAGKLPAGRRSWWTTSTRGRRGGSDMTDLVERWPAETAQLVLASRITTLRYGSTGCGCPAS